MLVLRLLIVNVVPLDWMLLFLIVLSGNDDPLNQMLEMLVLIGRLVYLTQRLVIVAVKYRLGAGSLLIVGNS